MPFRMERRGALAAPLLLTLAVWALPASAASTAKSGIVQGLAVKMLYYNAPSI